MKMQHITIHTAKLDESMKFYKEIAGLDVQAEFNGGVHNIVFLANAKGETCVELLEDADAAYSGRGISIGFHVNNVETYREELMGKGFDVSPLISPNPKTAFFFTKDPNGVEIQFI